MHEAEHVLHATGGSNALASADVTRARRAQLRRQPAWPTTSAVIPTLNEADNLRWLLPRLSEVDEVVIVDGESDDDTIDVVRSVRPDAVIVSQPPTGKGAALRAGFDAATGEVIVMLDADASMDPNEIDTFLAVICRGFDVVKGSRYLCGGGSDDLTLLRKLGNRWLTRLANVLYRTEWSDLCYGYIALRKDAVGELGLTSDGFEIETELCVSSVAAGLRIAEVPSHELRRQHGVSKLNTWRDGWRVLREMARFRAAARKRSASRAAQSADTVPFPLQGGQPQ